MNKKTFAFTFFCMDWRGNDLNKDKYLQVQKYSATLKVTTENWNIATLQFKRTDRKMFFNIQKQI